MTIFPTKTYACGCLPPGPTIPFYNDIKNVVDNDIVFIGKVEKIEPQNNDLSSNSFSLDEDLVTISDVFHIKGNHQKSWNSINGQGNSSCSSKIYYELNKHYVIFGSMNEYSNTLYVLHGACERVTAPLEDYLRGIFYQTIYSVVFLFVLFFLTRFLFHRFYRR